MELLLAVKTALLDCLIVTIGYCTHSAKTQEEPRPTGIVSMNTSKSISHLKAEAERVGCDVEVGMRLLCTVSSLYSRPTTRTMLHTVPLAYWYPTIHNPQPRQHPSSVPAVTNPHI